MSNQSLRHTVTKSITQKSASESESLPIASLANSLDFFLNYLGIERNSKLKEFNLNLKEFKDLILN